MADSFFGFETDTPALGAGKMEMGNELMEAPEDEETFDMMNDETFGDGAGLDEDWEQQHERFSFHHEFKNENGDLRHMTNDFGMKEMEIEKRIDQLVVDDDDIDDPAIMTITKRQPIPQRKGVNLDNLFGPSSPPGFLSSEHLVSPGKGNIWGSPVQEEPRRQEGIQNLLQMLNAGESQVTNQSPLVIHAKPSGSQNVSDVRKLSAGEIQRPRAMTVEELEMEMRGELPERRNNNGGFPIPGSSPGHVQFMQQNQFYSDQTKPGSSPISIAGHGSSLSSTLRHGASHAISPHGRGMHVGSPPVIARDKSSPGGPVFMTNNQNRQKGPFIGSPGQFSDLRDGRGFPPRGMPPPHIRQQLFQRSGPRGMFSGPPPPPGRGGYPREHMHRDGPKEGYSSREGMQNGFFDRRMPDGHEGNRRGRGDWRGGRGGRGNYRTRRDSFPSGEDDCEDTMYADENKDPYTNLMTQREKEWIIKIQLMQLHTDNPYVDDYYFTSWQMKRLAEERLKTPADTVKQKDGKPEPKLMLPQLAKVDNKSYKPIEFEGSLGRLTSSSVHNPRKIIVVDTKNLPNEEDPKAHELRKFKQLLIHVEKTYDILLEIDELEKKALALPEEARHPVLEERHKKTGILLHWLKCENSRDNSFLKLITLKKKKVPTATLR